MMITDCSINDLKELKGRGTLDSAQHSDLT